MGEYRVEDFTCQGLCERASMKRPGVSLAYLVGLVDSPTNALYQTRGLLAMLFFIECMMSKSKSAAPQNCSPDKRTLSQRDIFHKLQ